MSVSVPEFWNLAIQSQAITPEQCQQLAGSYAAIKGADTNGGAAPLVEWLVAQRAISRYQGKVLLARQPGPFLYGDYLVYDRVESGRLAGMFRAVHRATGHPVCLYFLTGAAAQDPQKFAELTQFGSRVAPARSPHLLRCFQVVDSGRYKFVAVEDPQGDSLESRLASGPIPPPMACALARQIALGLTEIHRLGQCHGELRPSNVFVDVSGVKLLYFPLWRDPAAGPTTPAAGGEALAAAADYLAPEVAAGQTPDVRGDIYSLGCLLHQMLTGRPLFDGGQPQQKLARHQAEPPPNADQINTSVPQPVAQVVGFMLQKDPASRYQSADNVAQALQPYVDPAMAQPQEQIPPTLPAYESWLSQQQAPQPAAPQPAAPKPTVAPAAPVVVQPAAPVVSTSAPAGPVISTGGGASSQPATLASRRSQSHSDRKNRQTMILCGSILGAALVMLLIFYGLSGKVEDPGGGGGGTAINTGPTKKGTINPPPKNGKNGGADTKQAPPGRQEVPIAAIRGETKLRYAPTFGTPLDLSYMPRGAQAFIVLRPAELIAHPEGKMLLVPQPVDDAGTYAATGPDFGPWALAEVSRLCGGLKWEQIEQVVIGLLPNPPVAPQTAVVMRTTEPVSLASLKQAAGLVYRMPGGSETVVVAAPDKKPGDDFSPIDDAMKNGESEPTLSRPEMEALLRVSDNHRQFSILCAPGFFYTDGLSIWSGLGEKLKEPLAGFLGDPHQLQAGYASIHLTEEAFFFELRLYGVAEKTHTVVASELDQQLSKLPAQIEDYVASNETSLFSKKILLRFPQMVRIATEETIVGTCQKHAVLRGYLPTYAASNLTHASYLLLADRGGGGGSVTKKKTPQPKTLAEALKVKKYTLEGREEFQVHVKSMSDDTGIPIEFFGTDLQSEGITKNQSTSIKVADKPVGEVLQEMFKLVDPAGRLVYVIRKEDGKEKVYITVRKKAMERGDTIPPEFPAPKKKP